LSVGMAETSTSSRYAPFCLLCVSSSSISRHVTARGLYCGQVDGRVRSMAANAFAVYVGGDFGLAVYQDSSGIRTLFTAAPSAAVYGTVASLAVADHADSCIYMTGALVDAPTGRSARLARRCLAAGSPSFEISAFGQDDQSRLHSLTLQAS